MAASRIDELRRRIERDPGSRLFAQLAEELRKVGRHEEAIAVARAGLQRQPEYPSARLTLGRALLDSGDAAGARTELEGAIRGAPDNILASRLLGEALERLGDLQGALSQLRRTLGMAPADVQVRAKVRAIEERLGAGGASGATAAGTTGDGRPTGQDRTTPMRAVRREELPAGAREGETGARPVPIQTQQGAGWAPGAGVPIPRQEARARDPLGAEAGDREAGETTGGAATDVGAPGGEGPTGTGPRGEAGRKAARASGPEGAPSGGAGGVAVGGEVGTVRAAPEGRAAEAPPVRAPKGSAEAGGRSLSSGTLAELYFEQGLPGRAVEVYRKVLEAEPRNEAVRARVAEIEAVSGPSSPTEGGERATRRRAIERTIQRLEEMLAVLHGR